MLIGIALGILVLIVCSAMTSATETAITAVSPPGINVRARQGDRAAIRLEKLLSAKESTIGALLLANNVFNILGAALATDLFLKLIGEAGVAVATLVMTVLVVIFAEVLPKTYAIRDPERFALRMALPATLLVEAAKPISFVLGQIVYVTLRAIGADTGGMGSDSPSEQLRNVLAGWRGDVRLGHRRRQMLRGVLELDRAKLDIALTHRARIYALPVETTLGEALAELRAQPYSRIPLWRDEPDNIIGILHIRDLIGIDLDTPLEKIMAEPWFVPVTTSLQSQLDAFIKRRSHMALVVDEYGELMGLITLEDIIEEITGEIDDERDRARPRIDRDPTGAAVVPGHWPIGEVNRLMDWDLPLDETATIGGLMVQTLGRIPAEGEIVQAFGHRIEVATGDRQRITSVRLLSDPQSSEES